MKISSFLYAYWKMFCKDDYSTKLLWHVYLFPQTKLLRENEKRKFCPVGKVFDEVKVLIFDNDLNQMPIGMPGEVCSSGIKLLI